MSSSEALVRVVLTAKHTKDRLKEKRPLRFEPAAPLGDRSGPSVCIDIRPRFQTIEGFGGAFTEAAAVVLQSMPARTRAAVLRDYFDPECGHGYTVGRLHINSCDFGLGNWACDEVAGDVELSHFSIARDQKAIIPMVKAAQELADGKIKLFASPWSPPPWMKTNGEMNHGGQLKPEYREVWARYYCRFIKEYARAGVRIWGLTVQNEPLASQSFDSCVWSGAEERDFVRDYLGPTLHKSGLGRIKLMIWDHNRDKMYERAKAVYDDPKAAKYVWGTAFHWYDGNHFDNVQKVHDAWPDKKLFFSEGCMGGARLLGETWEQGERYGESLINDLNRWTVGWTDWNLLLDHTGGPRHVGGPCTAPVLYNRLTRKVTRLSSYYYVGHFSRFIRPGAQRVVSASTTDAMEVTSFINTDGTVATVLMNRTENAIPFELRFKGSMARCSLPARAIMTLIFPTRA